MKHFLSLFTLSVMATAALAAPTAPAPLDALKFCQKIESAKGKRKDGERLKDYIRFQWDYAMREYPESATYVGYPGQNGRWTDLSLESIVRRKKETVACLAALESIGRKNLAAEDRLNLDLLLYDTRQALAMQRFPGELLQISQLDGVHLGLPQMFDVMPGKNKVDYEDLLSRLRAAPKLIAQVQRLLEEGLKKKITTAKVSLQGVPAQLDELIETDLDKSPFLEKFRSFPADFAEAEKKQLTLAARKAVTEELLPALRKFRAFFKDFYLPGARDTIGASALPDGQAWYEAAVKQNTTLPLKPAEVHALGMSEVKRLRTAMETLKNSAGFDGDLKEFFEFLRSDKRFFYETAEELILGYRDIAKRIDPNLMRQFKTLPRQTYGVLPVPSYKERSSPTAYYESGSNRAGRPGYFYANSFKVNTRPKWEMEALTLHEAVPGHHLQIALAQEQENLPEFRRFGGYNVYSEGWALYAESLGADVGVYKDVYSQMGQLVYEMWRSVRLVVDTGMHALGWTREKAIAFFEENTPKSRLDIEVEVDRYIAWPGQALGYKIGELKIKELKQVAKQTLGEKFDVREFHDLILKDGALPMTLLEARVRERLLAPAKR